MQAGKDNCSSPAANPSSHSDSHFDSAEVQFSAGKLGMWLFLATEIMLFAGLFCIYAVYRSNHPDAFEYGHRYLDTTWGSLNTLVLILSSFTVALAVRAAQQGFRKQLVCYLSLTLLLGFDFLGVKTIEYSHKFHSNLLWGKEFKPQTAVAHEEPLPGLKEATVPSVGPGDTVKGQKIYLGTCAGCHGQSGQGMPGLGKDIRESEFIGNRGETELVQFLLEGRSPNDPLNTTGKPMPPKGGNTALNQQDLADVSAYLKEMQKTSAAGTRGRRLRQDLGTTEVKEEKAPLLVEKSFIPLAPDGPHGLRPEFLGFAAESLSELHNDPGPPLHAATFFSIYFLMTGLHGLHVILGLAAIFWLLIRAMRGDFGRYYYTPVDLGGLYWHLVDVIWIFLFPLLYLIH